MKTKFQPFATALIGSMPRSQAVATAKADLAQKKLVTKSMTKSFYRKLKKWCSCKLMQD